MTTHITGITDSYSDKEYEITGEMDLNKVQAAECDGITKHPTSIVCEGVEVLFEKQRERIIEMISRSSVVVGCIAWLTDFAILAALRGKEVCIIVQKEDFLRPDLNSNFYHKQKLRDFYDSLSGICRFNLNTSFSTKEEDTIEPAILCAGLYNKNKKPAWPRMHHKFMLFQFIKDFKGNPMPATEEDLIREDPGYSGYLKLGHFDAVFTGSYNFTWNASNSLENSVILTQQPIIKGYYEEFERIFGISEPLDWNSEWVNPRYRIGT
jgi:hypothetical protein